MTSSPAAAEPTQPLPRPSKATIAGLPPYAQLPPECIRLVGDAADAASARQALRAAGQVGFDTESRPVFTAGAEGDGPHVIQFATRDQAFIVQAHNPLAIELAREIAEAPTIVKVGFGLASDRAPLWRKFGIRLVAGLDLALVLRQMGYRQAVGVRTAVAIVLGRRLAKPKAVTTSNWSLPTLRPKQLQYAADDAHAAITVYHALGRPGVIAAAADYC